MLPILRVVGLSKLRLRLKYDAGGQLGRRSRHKEFVDGNVIADTKVSVVCVVVFWLEPRKV